MAAYDPLATENTVQVLSPTLVQPVVYSTIRTNPSHVIASLALDEADFNAGTSGTLLTWFADNIETIMNISYVISGVGEQTIDANGLIADNVTFTVQYVPSGSTGTSLTADAVVPVGLLTGAPGGGVDVIPLQEAEAIVAGVYANLGKLAAG